MYHGNRQYASLKQPLALRRARYDATGEAEKSQVGINNVCIAYCVYLKCDASFCLLMSQKVLVTVRYKIKDNCRNKLII